MEKERESRARKKNHVKLMNKTAYTQKCFELQGFYRFLCIIRAVEKNVLVLLKAQIYHFSKNFNCKSMAEKKVCFKRK